MRTVKIQKPSPYLSSLFVVSLIFTITPLTAKASTTSVYALADSFYPDGETPGQEFTINVGDTIQWGLYTYIHTIVADTTQGDYQGNLCYEPGGLHGIIYEFGQFYYHTFTVPQLCYYRCTLHPPASGYPGMQGVIVVSGSGTTTTTSTSTTTTMTTTSTTTTTTNQSPTAVSLSPVNVTTAPSVAQAFTATYSDPNGYTNIATATLLVSGNPYNERVDYNRATNKFTVMGAGGNCSPGQAATLSDGNLTLNCSSSSISGSGNNLTVVFNLTPQPPLSGSPYSLMISVVDQSNASNSKTPGTWTINRPPSVGNTSPMSSTTPVGTEQTFTIVFSDPDGYQNIAAANFYMSGNGGAINQWLHYIPAPNLFIILGSNDSCSPGQAKTLTNSDGSLSFNCAASTVTGAGTNLTVVFKATPLAASSGVMYTFFNNDSDQAGGAFTAIGGTWQIQ
jgi:plastocyanin